MQKVTIIGSRFVVGVGTHVGLTADQAHVRRHVLTPTDIPEVYEVRFPVEFKKGEVIMIDVTGLNRAATDALGLGLETTAEVVHTPVVSPARTAAAAPRRRK